MSIRKIVSIIGALALLLAVAVFAVTSDPESAQGTAAAPATGQSPSPQTEFPEKPLLAGDTFHQSHTFHLATFHGGSSLQSSALVGGSTSVIEEA